MKLIVKVLTPHSAGCRYENERPYFPTNPPVVDWGGRDAIGRKINGGNHRWAHLKCNNTQCSGEFIVRMDSIEDAVLEALNSPTTGIAVTDNPATWPPLDKRVIFENEKGTRFVGVRGELDYPVCSLSQDGSSFYGSAKAVRWWPFPGD